MPGKFYGVGVGPGDPELITLKAKRILEEADYIAIPKSSETKGSVALSIIEGIVEERKSILELVFPMTFNEKLLKNSWNAGVRTVKEKLDEGKNVALITLGDPTVYSTYMYIHKALKEEGYSVNIVPGITSFCASAARSEVSLAENKEKLAVIPSAYECENLEDILRDFENIVLMKVSKNFGKLKETLRELGLQDKAVLVSKCGFEDELIEFDLENIQEDKLSYFTTMIIKKNGVK